MIEELRKAKSGDILSTNKIIKNYEYYIYYLMNEYQIIDKEECYDVVIERILKSIYKFSI